MKTSSNQIYRYFHPTVLYIKSKYSQEKRRKEGRKREQKKRGTNERREGELMEADEQRTMKWKNEERGERKCRQVKCKEKHLPWV